MSEGSQNKELPRLLGISGGCSHAGHVREINEDAMVCRDDIGVWAVADGMGGHERGDFASQTVIQNLKAVTSCATPKDLAAAVLDSLQNANGALFRASKEADSTIGTTVVTLLLHSGNALAVWSGDSRLYRLRETEFEQITSDHTVVQQLVDDGALEKAEADNHPHSHVLTQAIGVASEFMVDVAEVNVQPGDRLMLVSDGVYGSIPAKKLSAYLTDGGPTEAADRIIEAVLAGQAADNATVIVVDVGAA